MLSRITRTFGAISTRLRELVAPVSEAPFVTALFMAVCTYVHFRGYGWFFSFPISQVPFAIFGYQVTHPTFEHLFGNMLFLFLVGPSVERYLGHLRYSLLLVLSGVGAALGFALIYPSAQLVGASGAIAGLIAIYPLVHRKTLMLIMGTFICSIYFYLEFMSTITDFIFPDLMHVAHLAHLMGGLSGLFLFYFLDRD